jgi:hypothetical protein
MLLQIMVLIFVLFAWTRALSRFREKKLSGRQFIFWSAVWTIILLAVFFQSWTMRLSSILGIARGADLIVYVSVVLLFYLMFRLYVKMEKIEQDITKVVRKISIEETEKKRKNR